MFPRRFFPGGYFPPRYFPDGFFQALETSAKRSQRHRKIIRRLRKLRWEEWLLEAGDEPLVRKEREDAPKVKKPTRRKR